MSLITTPTPENPQETNKLLLSGGIALILGVIHNILFFDVGFGINFPIFTLCVLIGGYILTQEPGVRPAKSIVILAILALFFSIMVFVRSSALLTFFNIVGVLLLCLLIVATMYGKKLVEYIPEDFLKTFILPFKFISPFFRSLWKFFELRKFGSSGPKVREILRGVVMAVLAIIIFTLLFSSADLVFGKFVQNLFSFSFSVEPFQRVILFIFVAAFFLGAFGRMFKKHEPQTVTSSKPRTLGSVETNILFGSLNILFVIFIVLQLTYLFGGESHIISQGLTYAEYARKGFFELIAVAVLAFIILSSAEKYVVKKETTHKTSFKVLSTLFIAQVVIILVSAFTRLSFYEHAYGFSTIRLYSYALMIWIAVILILLAYQIITGADRKKFALGSFSCVVLLLVCMNLINPDAFIAKRNLERYKETGKIDAHYLADLSYDALPYTIVLLDDKDEMVKKDFQYGLGNSSFYRHLYTASWQSTSATLLRAKELLKSHKEVLDLANQYQ